MTIEAPLDLEAIFSICFEACAKGGGRSWRHTPMMRGTVACHHGVFHRLYRTKVAGRKMPSQIQ